MKKILFATVCATTVLLGSYATNAQEAPLLPPPPHEGVMPIAPFHHGDFRKGKDFDNEKFKEKMMEKMKEREAKFAEDLALTPEQKEQAKKIHEEGRKEVEPLMKDMKTLREKMDSLREKNMKNFESILTQEQKDKLEKMKAEKKYGEHKKWGKQKECGKDCKCGEKGEIKKKHKAKED